MGRVFLAEMEGRAFRCKLCESPLALADDVLSRTFNCRQGRAYLFSSVKLESRFLNCNKGVDKDVDMESMLLGCLDELAEKLGAWHRPDFSTTSRKRRINVMLGPQEERLMLSGLHTVEDIYCCCCGRILGWKYVIAHDKNQKYKEGKFVLERRRIDEDAADELDMDAHPGSSDAENL